MKYLYMILAICVATLTSNAQSDVVETVQLFGFDEGAVTIKGSQWQTVTKTLYQSSESLFTMKAVPSGYTREYWIGFRKADIIDACSPRGIQLRFYFSWADVGGHYFDLPRNWGSHTEGDYQWVKVPGSDAQKNALGLNNNYWRIEARIPSSCAATYFGTIYGVYMKAVDVPGSIPPVAIVANNEPEGTSPAGYRVLGIGNGLFMKNGMFAMGKSEPNATLDIYSQSANADNLILSANYPDKYRWRFRTIDRGAGAIDLDLTASNVTDQQETVLKLSRSNSGRPEFAIYENWLVVNNNKVGINTAQPDEALTVKGKIHTEEVRVDLSVPAPDYVFAPDYDLLPLSEVESYIKANKHLPEVPSAKQMEEEGLNLKEMNLLLLKKVEELTLHLIELKKENEEQQKEINALKNK